MAHFLRRSVASSSSSALCAARLLPAGAPTTATATMTSLRLFSTSPLRANAPASGGDEAIVQKIKDELKAALKGKKSDVAAMLKSVLSEHQYAQKNSSSGSPASVIATLRKAMDRRTEAAAQYAAAKREDLAEKERGEAAFLLERFMPKQMEDGELSAVVQEVLQVLKGEGVEAKKLMGLAMKGVKAKVEGRAEGKRLKEAIEEAIKRG